MVLRLFVLEERHILLYKPTTKMGILIGIMENAASFVQSDLVNNFQPQKGADAIKSQVIAKQILYQNLFF